MSKRENLKTSVAGEYVWRNAKSGRISALKIAKPQKGPTSTSLAKIRRAVRETNAAIKTK
jgi:hypothetical protein